jgi:hypothetical protein
MVAGMVHSISSARTEAMPSRSLAAYAVKNVSMVTSLRLRTSHSIWSKRGACCGLSLHRTRAVVLSERESWSNGTSPFLPERTSPSASGRVPG